MGFRRVFTWILAAFLSATAAGCGRDEPPADRHQLTGQVLAVRPQGSEVVIRHDDIPNFMPGMTMPFKVRDEALLSVAKPGDLVTATLVVQGFEAWLEAIQVTGQAPLTLEAPPPSLASQVHILQPGDRVPDTALVDQDGQPLALPAWQGQAVAVTFMFTKCPLPQFCPMMDRRFAEVQRIAQADQVLRDRVRLLSVSFDPASDTPAVLRAHATKIEADPAVWRFATAEQDVVDRFAMAFGVNVIREADGSITHNLRTAVVGPDGVVLRIYDGNEWTAEEIADDLKLTLGARASGT